MWRIEYSHEIKAFLPKTDYDKIVFSFIGDHTNQAKKSLIDELTENNRLLSGRIDMEPLTVLLKMIRDTSIDTIDGAIQIAKIYPPGVSASRCNVTTSGARRHSLGGMSLPTTTPLLSFIDPDTAEVVGEALPDRLMEIREDEFGVHYKFVVDCYPNNLLKNNLSERAEKRLRGVLKDVAYTKYVSVLNMEAEDKEE